MFSRSGRKSHFGLSTELLVWCFMYSHYGDVSISDGIIALLNKEGMKKWKKKCCRKFTASKKQDTELSVCFCAVTKVKLYRMDEIDDRMKKSVLREEIKGYLSLYRSKSYPSTPWWNSTSYQCSFQLLLYILGDHRNISSSSPLYGILCTETTDSNDSHFL